MGARNPERIPLSDQNNTWRLVPRPPNRKIVTNKWAFKYKKNKLSKIVRLKAKLVARGFSQIYTVHYLDTYTYALVVKLGSVGIFLAIAAIYGIEILQMDVVTAFLARGRNLHGATRRDQDHVCKLRKSLYNLKQAPRPKLAKATITDVLPEKKGVQKHLMSSNVCNARYETEPGAVDSTDLAILYETHQNGRKRSKGRLSISQWNGGRRDYIQR
jgi:hypothetical protein